MALKVVPTLTIFVLLQIDNVLNYDKMEHGTVELDLGEVDINEILRKSVSAFKLQAQRKKLNMSLDCRDPQCSFWDTEGGCIVPSDSGRVVVIGDNQRLRQVMRNIISNALKFSPEHGNIEISVDYSLTNPLLGEPTSDGDYSIAPRHKKPNRSIELPLCGTVHIQVKDEGVGLTADQTSTIFQEGVQFDASKLQDGGGCGLGMYISKELVELHGGRISVDSAGIGQGILLLRTAVVIKRKS